MPPKARRRSEKRSAPADHPPATRARSPVIVPCLPNDLALVILVRLPRALHGRFRCVSRAWRDALDPSSVNALRNSLRMSETWFVFSIGNHISLYDPLLHHFSTPIRFPRMMSQVTLGATGCFILVTRIRNFEGTSNPINTARKIHCFDVACMQWQPDLIPLWYTGKTPRFNSVATDENIYVIENSPGRVARLDMSARTWELMPKMKKARIDGLVSALQGCLYVIGGWKFPQLRYVRSGEIWDPSSHTWTLHPELFFKCHCFVVVMDTLHAVKKSRFHHDDECGNEWKLMQYVNDSKLWLCLGYFSIEKHICSFCKQEKDFNFVGVGKELWLMFNCPTEMAGKNCRFEVLSHVPTLGQASPLVWRPLPITFSVKFPRSGHTQVHGKVNV